MLIATCNDKQAASYSKRLYCLIEWWDIENWRGTFNAIHVAFIDWRILIQTILQPFEFELLLPSTCFHITEKLEKNIFLFFTQSRKTLDDSSNQLDYICEKSVGSPESEQCINFVIRIIASSADIWIDAELLVTCHCLQDNVLSDRAKRYVINQSYDHLHHNPPSLCEYLILRMINDRTIKKTRYRIFMDCCHAGYIW